MSQGLQVCRRWAPWHAAQSGWGTTTWRVPMVGPMVGGGPTRGAPPDFDGARPLDAWYARNASRSSWEAADAARDKAVPARYAASALKLFPRALNPSRGSSCSCGAAGGGGGSDGTAALGDTKGLRPTIVLNGAPGWAAADRRTFRPGRASASPHVCRRRRSPDAHAAQSFAPI